MALNDGFWRDRRVLITGHTGFKGGWLALWLHRMGAQLCGYALPPATAPSLFDAARIGELGASDLADVRDLAAMERTVSRFAPEIVFHLAAQALVPESYLDPVGTYATNVMGTVHVLEAVRRQAGVRAVVIVTSDKCYANREWVWPYREEEPLGGRDPYSSSKGCAELVAAAYRASWLRRDPDRGGTAVATARAGNVIGGGDWTRGRLIPDLVRAMQASEAVLLRRPAAIRPWQHVLEPVHGYLLLAEALWRDGDAYAEAWNFGPFDADARPVHRVVQQFAEAWGASLAVDVDPEAATMHEANTLKLDSSKARARLGWEPRWCLDEALGQAADWYKAHAAGADARSLCDAHIARFARGAQ